MPPLDPVRPVSLTEDGETETSTEEEITDEYVVYFA